MANMDAPQFEWDINKNASNEAKHGIGFKTAAYVFADPFNSTISDMSHSDHEQRWVTIGMVSWKLIVVVHTYPEAPMGAPIRIISSRFAKPAEIRYYERNEHE